MSKSHLIKFKSLKGSMKLKKEDNCLCVPVLFIVFIQKPYQRFYDTIVTNACLECQKSGGKI